MLSASASARPTPAKPASGWFVAAYPASRNLVVAVVASVALHAVVLSAHFAFPSPAPRKKANDHLDIVLVNSKSARAPTHVQALAQANMDGGGNTDQNRRAKSPLPALHEARRGESLTAARRRVRELEARQRQLLAQAKSDHVVNSADQKDRQPQQHPSGADLVQTALAIARLEAQVDRETDDYNKRPRKKEIGARTREFRFAQYVESWREKVERWGNLNYPEAAKGKLYGSLLLSVTIRADGSVQSVQIDRSSGYKVLDDAARSIVERAAPYAPFPPDIRRDYELIEITRTWTFTTADQLQSSD